MFVSSGLPTDTDKIKDSVMDYGCYKDTWDRDLDAGQWRLENTNTVEECVMHCHLKGNLPRLFKEKKTHFKQAQ